MENSQKFNRTKNKLLFKNLVIGFGVCVCFLMFFSSDAWISDPTPKEKYSMTDISVSDDADQVQEAKIQETQRTFTHYNFIASYLIQESSINRQSNEKKERGNFITNLKQIHKIIISNTLGNI